jgi:hypothetical protein
VGAQLHRESALSRARSEKTLPLLRLKSHLIVVAPFEPQNPSCKRLEQRAVSANVPLKVGDN